MHWYRGTSAGSLTVTFLQEHALIPLRHFTGVSLLVPNTAADPGFSLLLKTPSLFPATCVLLSPAVRTLISVYAVGEHCSNSLYNFFDSAQRGLVLLL